MPLVGVLIINSDRKCLLNNLITNTLQEFELSHLQVENDELKEQLEKVKKEKETLKVPSFEKGTPQQVW